MDWLIELLSNSDYISQLFSTESQTQITKYGVLIGVLWAMMSKRVGKHFQGLENSMREIVSEVRGVKEEVSAFKKEVSFTHRSFDKRVSNLEAYNEAHLYEIGELKRFLMPDEEKKNDR